MKDILRAALAVPALRVADVDYNKNAILKRMEEASQAGATLLVTPELSLTGATCGDLFFSDVLLGNVERALVELAEATPRNLFVAVGAPIRTAGSLYNCAVLLTDGEIVGIVPKNNLSMGDLRYFASASAIDDEEYAKIGDEEIALVAAPLRFMFEDGTAIGVTIGEDIFTAPSTDEELATGGAEVILNLSASCELVGRRAHRRNAVASASAKNMAAYLFVNAGAEESTADYLYAGQSLAAIGGRLIVENDAPIASDYLTLCDLDLGCIRYDRLKSCFVTTPALPTNTLYGLYADANGALLQVDRLPFIPGEKNARIERCMEIYEMQSAALARRLSVTGGKLTLGISGGLDSTLALLVAVRAMERLQLPNANITAVTMPCFGTSDDTLQNALELMAALGVTARTVSIKDAVLQHFKDIGHDPADYSVTYENAQARERTQVLMDIANQVGGIVLGTGDLSEMALGWCTYNGDHMSMYGVNANVPKTLVRWIVTAIAEEGIFPKASDVLLRIVDTPISPELLPPDAVGKIAQKTEDIVGPYALHDFFLYWAVRYQYTPTKIFALAKKAFEGNFDGATIKKWLTVFFRRFFNQQFKRNCVPDGVKVGSVGLSPRGDWQMPSDAAATLWLAEIDSIQV